MPRRSRTLSTAPWRRAVRQGMRQRGVVLAVAVASLVLALAASSAPLFLGSVRSAALTREVHEACPETSLPRAQNVVADGDPRKILDSIENLDDTAAAKALSRQRTEVPKAFAAAGLPTPFEVMTGAGFPIEAPGHTPFEVTMLHREGALDHVQIVEQVADRGIWIPDTMARDFGLRVGQTIDYETGSVRIAGTFRALAPNLDSVVPVYWCSWARFIQSSIGNRSTSPMVLVDEQTLLDIYSPAMVGLTWYAPLDLDRLTVPEARAAVLASSELDRDLDRIDPAFSTINVRGTLAADLGRAESTEDSVAGPIGPVALAGTLVALALVAGAGGYWVERRSPEVRLLASRGVGPAAIGTKAVLETMIPLLAGAVLGLAATLGLVMLVGPSTSLEPGAIGTAMTTVGAALVGALGVVGASAATRSRLMLERPVGARRTRWRLVPWEVLLLGGAIACYIAVNAEGGARLDTGTTRINPAAVAFGLLGVVGLVLLAVRLLTLLVPRLRRVGGRLPVAGYLALRRATGSPAVTMAVIALTAIPVAVLAFAATTTSSIERTVEEKSLTWAGAERSVQMLVRPGTDVDVEGHGTQVSLVRDGQITGGGVSDVDVQVIGIDPETFAAFANPLTGDGPTVAELAGLLESDGTPTAILVRPRQGGDYTSIKLRNTILTVRPVATVEVFPGLRQLRTPMVVVSRAAMSDVDPYADRAEEIWTTAAEYDAAKATLERADIQTYLLRSPTGFLSSTDLISVTWTFQYLGALAVLTGVVAICGLLLYLAARQRSRTVSSTLTARMGFDDRGLLVSLLLEVGVLVGLGWLLGTAGGLLTALPSIGPFEVNPDFPPAPVLALPWFLLGTSVAVAAVVALVASIATARTARKSNPAWVMRLDV